MGAEPDFDGAVDAADGSSDGNFGAPVQSCPALSCDQMWKAINEQVSQTASMSDPMERNKQISAQYAQLYQTNNKLEWVGLASIVSRQAGCAMAEADDASKSWIGMKATAARNARDGLAEANKDIYTSIYPAAKFYQSFGLDALKRCAGSGEKPRVSPKLVEAFAQIDQGMPWSVRLGSDMIANYEQRDVIQDQVYSQQKYYDAFAANEKWSKTTIGRWAGARPAELPLSSTCGGADNVPFTGSITDPDARVKYYNTLMDKFEGYPQAWRSTTTQDIINQAGR